MSQLSPQELDQIRNSMAMAKTPVVIAMIKAVLAGGIDNVHPDLLRICTDEIEARGISADMMAPDPDIQEGRNRNKMKLTESQARRAVRKWLFEFSTDSGVSQRMSTDDKIAGKLGDDREDQPASTIPQEIPIIAMSQMSTQLTDALPPIEDPNFIPGTLPELGKSVDMLSQQIPHEEIEWFYSKMQDLADEAIEKGNAPTADTAIGDLMFDEEEDIKSQVRPSQRSSEEVAAATNESWGRWSKLLLGTLSESRYNKPGKMTQRMRKPWSKHDMKLVRPDDDDDFLDGDDDDASDSSPTPAPSRAGDDVTSMPGTVINGRYVATIDEMEEQAEALEVDIESLPGFDPRLHIRSNLEVVQADGEEAKLRELVALEIFPNITTLSGMRKMIRNQIDPVVQIWFNANNLSQQMSELITSTKGLSMFFEAIQAAATANPGRLKGMPDEKGKRKKGMSQNVITVDNVLELKGARYLAQGLLFVAQGESGFDEADYMNKMIGSGVLKTQAKKYADKVDGNTGKTIKELYEIYETNKESNREVLQQGGLYSAVMAKIVVEPIIRKWTQEIKDGNIDISSSKNKGQVTWPEAREWVNELAVAVFERKGKQRKAQLVIDAMTGMAEFESAMDAIRDEAEDRAYQLEQEGETLTPEGGDQ